MDTKDKKQEEAKTVKLTVTSPFRDKFDHATMYKAGQEVEFEQARADDVIRRGLAEPYIVEG